jgi:hypothetical protein
LELFDPVDLSEGTEVTVTMCEVSAPENREAFQRAARGWQGTVDAEILITTLSADRVISTRPTFRR